MRIETFLQVRFPLRSALRRYNKCILAVSSETDHHYYKLSLQLQPITQFLAISLDFQVVSAFCLRGPGHFLPMYYCDHAQIRIPLGNL